MVGYLKGKILNKHLENNSVIIGTDHIGYEVTVPKQLFDRLPVHEVIELWIHTHVREDILQLFGFGSETEKQFFRLLLGVSGLGPRTAMALMSEHSPEQLSQHIFVKDIDAISEAPGVGKKLAQRLVLELGSKIEKLTWLTPLKSLTPQAKAVIPSPSRQLRDDLSSALLNLGYQPKQVDYTLDKILENEDKNIGFEGWLKTALREMSGRING